MKIGITFTKEIIAGILLLAVLCVCYYGFIPSEYKMLAHSILVVAFAAAAILTWHEKPVDERETTHSMISAQAAYTAGGLVLLFGMVQQGLTAHHIDPALYWAFGAMLAGKVIGKIWAQLYR